MDVLAKLYMTRLSARVYCPKAWSGSMAIPIHKKGDKKVEQNYRTIMMNNIFLNHKMMSKCCEILLRKLKLLKVNTMQAAFRKKYSCSNHLFLFRTIVEATNCKLRGKRLHTCIVDFAKAFDSIPRGHMWDTLNKLLVPSGLVRCMQTLYQSALVKIRVDGSSLNSEVC